MNFTPRPYQRLIIDHILRHPKAAVWAGMGTGKTVSTLTAIDYLQTFDGCGRALVIAPLRVARSSWPDEARKWKHLEHLWVQPIVGTPREREAALEESTSGRHPDVYTTNYENIPWLVAKCKARGCWPFQIVVADEATKLKSFRTRQGGVRTRALASIMPHVQRFIELTGTPAPNGLLDLWGQFWFLDQGERLEKTMGRYQEAYFRPLRVGADPHAVQWVPHKWTDRVIQEKVADLVVKVNAEDYFDIKQPIIRNLKIELPASARKVYQQIEREFFTAVDNHEIEAANAAVKTAKLLQVASGFLYVEDPTPRGLPLHDEKIEVLRSVVEEAAGMPVLVSYQFKYELARILEKFPQARHLDKNPKTIRDWNAGKIPILCAHPASCGHGLNLQDGGNILVFYSTGWNLEEHDQMVERIGPTRQKQAGHERPVFIYNIVAKNTIEEAVLQRIETKREVLDVLMERRNHA